jgi:serine/threonine-protein kinase
VIADEAPLPLERVLRIVDQIASALAAVHRRGIVHRDLKPQNIFLVRAEANEHVKLCDFGISKVRAASVALTGERVLLGTPQYMAPEQARATGEVDARADQFALAAIVYEMLSGRLAFPGDRLEIVVYRITNEDPLPLGAPWGPALGPVLDRALSKDPAARYASVEEFAAALRAAADARGPIINEVLARTTMRGAPGDAPTAEPALAPTTVPPRTVPGGRGRTIAGGLAALAVIGMIVAAAVRGRTPQAAAPPRAAAPTVVAAPPIAPAPPPAAAPPARAAREEAVIPAARPHPTADAPVRRKRTAALPVPEVAPTPETDQAPAPASQGSKRGSLIDRL